MADEDYKRKLAAILSADVAGYSRLMGDNEVATVSTLKSHRNHISDIVQAFNGRVVDSPGDNILAEFRSIVDAVSCAVAIQEGLQVENDELPENRKMMFRIGVNLGDVIQDGDRIYGDGVNIAARIEGLAYTGGVAISAHGLFETYRKDDNAKARELFERSVELDPNYAYAWTYLGWTYWIDAVYYHMYYDRKEWLENAETMAQKALSINDKSSDAYALLSGVYLSQGKYDEAV
ncbi:MAG: adenylate/guanylate cyclase domain-containing protein, partial [Desulfobacterales bacterium]